MRIATSMLEQSLRQGMADISERLARAQDAVTTGKRLIRASDDAVAATAVMQIDQGLRAYEQYRRNTATARTRTDAEQTVLQQVTDLLVRAKEIGVSQGTDTATPQTRAGARVEVANLLDEVIRLANTTVGDSHVFGGFQTGAPPFLADGSYVGDDNTHQVEIGHGETLATNHNGRDAFVTTGVMASLAALKTALATGTTAAVQGSLAGLDQAHSDVQTLLADVGARSNRLDVAEENFSAVGHAMQVQRSGLSDVDLEAAVTEFAAAQNTLQAALLTASRVLNVSLVEYLR